MKTHNFTFLRKKNTDFKLKHNHKKRFAFELGSPRISKIKEHELKH